LIENLLTGYSVDYEIPKSIHIHKSMLLRGVKFPPPTLDEAEIQAVKSKAQHSGRWFGGAPLRNGHGNNRGGRMNYTADRPNPFAAHLDPTFTPPPRSSDVQNPSHGWAPPPPGAYSYSPPCNAHFTTAAEKGTKGGK
jgi:5'-3' exoribonuclease 2